METKLIFRRDVIRGVRDRWLEQYRHYSDESRIGERGGEPKRDIVARLMKLDPETATVADVDAAIGVGGWADLECDFCQRNMEWLVRLGEEPDYEARWVDACSDCLMDAALKKPA